MINLLSQLLDRAAEQWAENEAFTDGTSRMTYAELWLRSNQLAHLLATEGAGRGHRVGIFWPREAETAVAVYGVLRSGAAFVPIDPQMPPGGLRQMIDDCEISHLVAHDRLASTIERAQLSRSSLEVVIGPDREFEGLRSRSWSTLDEHESRTPPAVRLLSDDPAYIMCSSGSTGRPKGILHTHRSGLAYAELSAELYRVIPEDRVGNHSPLHFDMSTFGYFTVPSVGATTVVIPEAHTKLVASLSELIERERISIWYSVPLALIQLVTRGVLEARDLSALRWVLFGGEAFAPAALRDLMQRLPSARFSNVYGPAEVNQCTYYHVPPLDDPRSEAMTGEPIPIGRVWTDAEGIIVDEHDDEVVEGETGELLIRSSTMMRGYWGRDDLNERAFYRDDSIGIERVFYRTGDMVRRRSDGELLFLGRKDRQVKVRGYRVELDDVEYTLGKHAAVEEAAVFPVRGSEGVQIAAAVTVRGQAAVTEEALRAYARDILSWYSVPQRISIVEALPRTGTDKIDRASLQVAAENAGGSS